MRQAKKLGVLGLVLGLVAALGLVAGGIRSAQAQTVNTCSGTASCVFSLTTTVVSGGTLTLTTTTPGVTITGVSTAGGGFFGACASAPFGGMVGIGTNSVTIGPCPGGTNIPAGTAITVNFAVPAGVTSIALNAIANANGPITAGAPSGVTCGTAATVGTLPPPNTNQPVVVTCPNIPVAATISGNSIVFTVTGAPGQSVRFGLNNPSVIGTCPITMGLPTPFSGPGGTATLVYTCGAGQSTPGTVVSLNIDTIGAIGAPTEMTCANVTAVFGACPGGVTFQPAIPAATTQNLVFTLQGAGNTGTQATKNCTGTGVAGSVLTCQITSGNSPIPPGGSVQVTSQAGWTITACTNTFNNAPVAAILASVSGTNVCVFQNTSAVAIPANSALGTEVQTIPTGAPVGTLVAQVASTCVNATVPCTIVAGSTAGAPVPVTGVTAVVAGAATNKQPTSVTLAAFLGSQTGTPLTLTSEASPSDLSATADLAGGSTTVKADALSLTGVNFISGTVTCPGGAPCADGTFQVSIVQTAIAPATAILGCDGASVAPAGGNPCQIVNNGQQVNVNCGTTAGLQPPAAAASATCTTFWFTVQSTIGSCLGNPLPIPVGGCNTLGNLGAGNSVTIQITFLATTGNGGQTGGLNILPGATLIFGAPGVSALVVSASPYSIPSNGTLASVITATFSCTGPLATQNNFLAPGTTLNQALAGTVLGGFLANPQACNPGLPGTFNFSSLGPVIFDNGRQNESVSCGPPGSLNTFGVGAIAGFGTNNLTPPLAFTCTGAAVLAIGAGAAGDAPINVTFTSAVGGVNAIGSTLLSVVPSGAPVIGIACNPSTVAAGGLGSICIATVTDINRIPLSGLTGATVTFTVSDPTQATIIPCLVNIPSATINVTTSPNILPQLLPGGPCATPSAGIPGQVNTFVNGQASAVLVPSPTAHPGPVTVTATIGILVPPSFACISAPYATGIPGVSQPVVQNVPALGNPGLYGCGSASPFGTLGGFSGLATGLSQASFGYTGIVTMPNATSASTVVQIGGQFGILIAGSSPTQPLALSRGCNQIIVTAASATPIANIAALVSPQSAVVSIWRFNNATKQFQAGFFSDPAAPTDFVATGGTSTAVSGGGNQLTNNGAQITETYFICVNQTATIISG